MTTFPGRTRKVATAYTRPIVFLIVRRKVWVPPRLPITTSILPVLNIAVMLIAMEAPGIPPILPLKKWEPVTTALAAKDPIWAWEDKEEFGLPKVTRLLGLTLFRNRLILLVVPTPVLQVAYLVLRLLVPLPRTPIPLGPTLTRSKKPPYTKERQSLGRLPGKFIHLLTPKATTPRKETIFRPPSLTRPPHTFKGEEFAGKFNINGPLVAGPVPPTPVVIQPVVYPESRLQPGLTTSSTCPPQPSLPAFKSNIPTSLD